MGAASPVDVARFAGCSSAAYLWGAELAAALLELGLQLIDCRDAAETDSQAFAAFSAAEGLLVFGFRGTEGIRDALTDAEVAVCGFQGQRMTSPTLVHSGFVEAWRSLATWASGVSERYAATARRIVVTGHSLGGALATLAAVDLWAAVPIEAFTYGSPRVGLVNFVTAYGIAAPATTRVVHGRDVVPRVPGFPYDHVCDPLRLDDQGRAIGTVGGWVRDALGFARQVLADLDTQAFGDHHVSGYVDACLAYRDRAAAAAGK